MIRDVIRMWYDRVSCYASFLCCLKSCRQKHQSVMSLVEHHQLSLHYQHTLLACCVENKSKMTVKEKRRMACRKARDSDVVAVGARQLSCHLRGDLKL